MKCGVLFIPFQSKMSLQAFLKEGKPVISVNVHVIQKIGDNLYIGEDNTTLCVLSSQKQTLQDGQFIKVLKPEKISEDILGVNIKFKVQDIKKMDIKPMDKKKREKEIERLCHLSKQYKPVLANIATFKQIDTNVSNIVNNVLVLVLTASKPIKSTYGYYQICGLKDVENEELAINMYDKYINRMKTGKEYKIEYAKKMYLQKEGEKKMRLTTTNKTIITEANSDEQSALKKAMMGNSFVQGSVVGMSDVIFYPSCPIHYKKLVNEECDICLQVISEPYQDFQLDIYVEGNDTLLTFQIFRRYLTSLKVNGEGSATIEKELRNKHVYIEYNRSDDQSRQDEEEKYVAKRIKIVN